MSKDEEELKYWSGAAFLLLRCFIIKCQNICKESISQESQTVFLKISLSFMYDIV